MPPSWPARAGQAIHALSTIATVPSTATLAAQIPAIQASRFHSGEWSAST